MTDSVDRALFVASGISRATATVLTVRWFWFMCGSMRDRKFCGSEALAQEREIDGNL